MINKTKTITLTIVFLLLINLSFVLADEVGLNARINEAQKALNAPGLDIASIFQTDFQDSIDPATGSLTISQTDYVIPGRNGHNAAITRKYSSNVFLHLSDGGTGNCGGPGTSNGVNNQACPDIDHVSCLTPNSISSQAIGRNGLVGGTINRGMKCQSSNSNGDQSSFIRGKYLGTGWSMNVMENKLKDPSPLIFDGQGSNFYPTYAYISSRGINSYSLVIDSNEQELILPSMFAENPLIDPTIGSDNVFWNYYTGFEGENFQLSFDSITKMQNKYFSSSIDAMYTDNLEPVFTQSSVYLGASIPHGVDVNAIYLSKDGKRYALSHQVNFCEQFDDTKVSTGTHAGTFCPDRSLIENDQVFNWAQNPYAGTYATEIVDNFGNTLTLDYYGLATSDPSPFVESIATTPGKIATFRYVQASQAELGVTPSGIGLGSMDIDTKLGYIKVPQPDGGGYLYRMYEYTNFGTKQIPLLTRTYMANSFMGTPIAGTEYAYNYNSVTRELTQVTLPGGATIQYNYAWASAFPSIDAVRGLSHPVSDFLYPKRVVISKTIRGGGMCWDFGYPDTDSCTWNYYYNSLYNSGATLGYQISLQTRVVDPLGNTVEYYPYPATATSLNYNG